MDLGVTACIGALPIKAGSNDREPEWKTMKIVL
jgi:hypothetical protein